MRTFEIWLSEGVATTGASAIGAGAGSVCWAELETCWSCCWSWDTWAWEAASCCSEEVRRPLRSAIFWSIASTSPERRSRKASTSSVS